MAIISLKWSFLPQTEGASTQCCRYPRHVTHWGNPRAQDCLFGFRKGTPYTNRWRSSQIQVLQRREKLQRHKNLLPGWLFWTYYNVHWDKTTSGRWQWFSLGNYNCHDYKLKSFSNSKSKNKQKNWSYLGDLQLYTLKINNTLLAFSFSWFLLPWVEIDHSYLLLDNYFSEQHGINFSSTKTDSAISKLDFAFRKA